MKIIILIVALIGLQSIKANERPLELAINGLRSNIVKTQEGPMLRAAPGHFSSIWVRDFCYSIEGLLDISEFELVKRQLISIISKRRGSDQLIPRVLDTMPSSKRVLRGLYPILGKVKPLDQGELRVEFVGEHKTVAIDSNLLVLKGLIQYIEATGDREFPFDLSQTFKELLSFYDDKFVDGLISQEDFGDWQDSVKRTGTTLLTNFHFWWVLNYADQLAIIKPATNLEAFKKKLIESFFDEKTGLFKSHLDIYQIGLDANLFILLDNEFLGESERNELYSALKASRFQQNIGMASLFDYPKKWRSFNVKLVGLSHYHDRLSWSWLMGLHGRVAIAMNDMESAKSINELLSNIVERDQAIGEIYRPDKNYVQVKTFLYKSAIPFSWGSAHVVKFLSEFRDHQ